jgi:nicotinamidase-related amidase
MRLRGVPIVYTQHGTPDPAAEEDTDVLVAFWGAAESIKCVSTTTVLSSLRHTHLCHSIPHQCCDAPKENALHVPVTDLLGCKAESCKAMCRRGSEAWQLVEGLGEQPDDTYITDKNTYDSFQNTSLGALLQGRGVDTVIVGGVITNACCETTARCAVTSSNNGSALSGNDMSVLLEPHTVALLRSHCRHFSTLARTAFLSTAESDDPIFVECLQMASQRSVTHLAAMQVGFHEELQRDHAQRRQCQL